MVGFAIQFMPPADVSGNVQRFNDDAIIITYDKFYEYYMITSLYHNSPTKHMTLNTFNEVVSFLHSLYKFVNMDMVNKSNNYIAFVQVDAGMFPSIQFSRKELLKPEFVADLDQVFATWATVTVPGIQRMVALSQGSNTTSPKHT
jgi:hypothetical protein